MARRPALAALAALSLSLAATAALPGCAQRPQQAPLRSLDRSGRASLACIGALPDSTGNPGRPMLECDSTVAASIVDFTFQFGENGQVVDDVPHVYALVTQQTRGEVAVIDMSVDPAISQSILDADLWTPGLNFLPVGAQPIDIVTSGLGGGAFVAAAEPGRPGIYALPSTELRGPALQDPTPPTATLRSWPACRLPAAPGRILAVQSALEVKSDDPSARLCPSPNPLRDTAPYPQPNPAAGDAPSLNVVYPDDAAYPGRKSDDPLRPPCGDGAFPPTPCKTQLVPAGVAAGAEKLLVTLPERGELVVIDAQALFDRPPGSFDPCPIERAIELRVDLPDAPLPPPAAGDVCPAQPTAAPAVGVCPTRPQRSVAYPAAFESRPAAMALGGGRLYIADDGAPVIHVISLEDGCGLRELPPLLPGSVDEPARPVYTSSISVSPLTSDQRTFLYAVDRERGTVMAFDVSTGSADRSPLLRERPDLKVFGSRDRLSLGGTVREVTFVEAAENVVDEQGFLRNGSCDPYVPEDQSQVDPARGDVFRTNDTYTDGAAPTRLRGVFALATMTSGQVRVIDVDDLDAPCRGARTAGGFPQYSGGVFSDLPASLTGCESCAIGTDRTKNTLGASSELSCDVVSRHEMRSGFFFANKSATGLHAPTFQSYPVLTFNGSSLRTDTTEDAQPNPKLLGPAVPNPFYDPGQPRPQPDKNNCLVQSPFSVNADCQQLDVNGNVVDPPDPARQVPNPNYAAYDPNRPSLNTSWSFERGGLPVAAESSPSRAERNFVVPDFRQPRAHIDQTWTVWFEGPLPGFDGRFADSRLGASEPTLAQRGFFDPDASFCGAGVHDWDATLLEGARLLNASAGAISDARAARAAGATDENLSDEAKAIFRFASRHADYVQIADELLPPEDPYWVAADQLADSCNYYTCEAAFGPATNPTTARDFLVSEAYQDRVLITDARPRTLDPDCCFPTLVRYRVRAHNAWTVVGNAVGFLHRTVVNETTGRCVDEGVDQATGAFCDPLLALRNSRAYEAVNPGVSTDLTNPEPPPLLLPEPPEGADDKEARWPCRDEFGKIARGLLPNDPNCFPPKIDDPIVFQNGVLRFIPYQGAEPSRRDMVFSWSMTGGFVPLQIDLGSRGAIVAPFASVFSPELRRLIVTDGGQNGVFSLSLATFGYRSYL